MWIALYINCVQGIFKPRVPFETAGAARLFCRKQDETASWEIFEVEGA